jgi:hypothetical protein
VAVFSSFPSGLVPLSLSSWRLAERGSGAGRGCSVSGDALKAGPADLPRHGAAALC